jgi:hypothetical protein
MIKGKTKSGFEFELDEDRLENYELLEAISEIEDNPLVISKVIRLLLGNEGTESLKDHVRRDDGIVPVKALTNEITEIFQSQNETKNS